MAKRDDKRRPLLPDWHLWRDVADTVSPLRRRLSGLPAFGGEPLPMPAPVATPRPESGPVRPPRPLPSYKSPGHPGRQQFQVIEPRLRQRLGRGQIEIDGTLDLHGMRQAEAHGALTRFIHARAARGDRTLLVITGKGLKKVNGDPSTIVERGVLRTMLPIWLSEPGLAPLVAGWDVAAQGHGGEGAYYVRLRRER